MGGAFSLSTLLVIVFGVWLIPCIALPFIKKVNVPEEHLLFIRGGSAAILSAIILRGKIFQGADIYSFFIGLTFALAAVGLYKGMRSAWGGNRSVVTITTIPAFNVLAAWFIFDRPVSMPVLICLVLLLLGILIALQPWHKEHETSATNSLSFTGGFFATLAASVTAAAMYE